jgi:DNA-binding response OmpR family regulator
VNAILSASRFQGSDEMIPRLREAGDVTLDLFHRDGRVEDCWLGLHPREFALVWRLAEYRGNRSKPGQVWTWGSGSVNLPSAIQ